LQIARTVFYKELTGSTFACDVSLLTTKLVAGFEISRCSVHELVSTLQQRNEASLNDPEASATIARSALRSTFPHLEYHQRTFEAGKLAHLR
jgi:hypothetical protein